MIRPSHLRILGSEEKESFIARLEGTIPNDPPLRIRLEGNRRARTEQARAALWAGPLLEAGGEAVHDVLDRLLDVYRDCPDLGSASDAPRCFRGRPAGLRSCAEPMAKRCSCRRPCVERPSRIGCSSRRGPSACTWIAGVFQGWMRSSISARPTSNASPRWLQASILMKRGRPQLDRWRRRRAPRGRPAAAWATSTPPGRCAPGRAENGVGGLKHSSLQGPGVRSCCGGGTGRPHTRFRNLAEETRVLYVALTRARDDIS